MKDENPNAGLRQEIVESQKTQADFLKWKLIAVGLLSAAALGLNPANKEMKYLLCLIPLLCGYVDLISLHLMIRIITIGAYLKESGNQYEDFAFYIRKHPGNPFVFEPGALHGSSLIFNLLIVVLGWNWASSETAALQIAGGIGLLWSIGLWLAYVWHARQVTKLAAEFFKQQV